MEKNLTISIEVAKDSFCGDCKKKFAKFMLKFSYKEKGKQHIDTYFVCNNVFCWPWFTADLKKRFFS